MLVPFFAHVHVCHSVVSNSLLRPVQKHPTKVFQSVFVCVRARARAHARAQLCLTLCDLLECSLPGSSVHGIFQARILELSFIASEDLPNPGIESESLLCL